MKYLLSTLTALLILITSANAQGIVLDMQHMEQIKNSEDAVLKKSQEAVVRAADNIINEAPATVTNKKLAPPSGDMHDYYSMARYWWPNPKTADHLPYVRRDGQVNPETTGLDRDALSLFGRQMQIFTLAYYYSGNERYAQKAWECLRCWYLNKKTHMNPNMNYSQVVLGRDDNKGRKEGLLDTYTMLPINDYLNILSKAKCAKPQEVEQIRTWFADFLKWMLESEQGQAEYNAKNNHGTAYHIQVAAYAAAVGDTALCRSYINEFTQRRIMTQFEPDGRQPRELVRTTAFGYSCFNLGHVMDMLDIARLQGLDLTTDSETRQRIIAAIDFLVQFLGRPVTSWPYQQIKDWDKQQQNLCWILYRAHRYFPEKDYLALFYQHNTAKPSSRDYLIY